MPPPEPCVIVGASHAAAQLAASLRQEGWEGGIVLVGDEPSLPYHRPPLSKAFLSGEKNADDLAIRPAAFYEKKDIRFQQGRVTEIDRDNSRVILEGGGELSYSKLALCVGARPRPLEIPGSTLSGVHYLRDMADVVGIQVELRSARTAVIIGGGYIGLEAAASLRKQGLEVTVLEYAERVLERVTCAELSAFYTRIHADRGVVVRTGTTVGAIEGDERVEKVVCSNGDEYPADLVIVGVGVLPNVELAEAAGLEIDNGVVVDSCCRTSDPDIVAVGDCSNQPSERYRTRLRLESVPNATAQAKAAAAVLCGTEKPNNSLPWFWSDQYEFKLQIAGVNTGYNQVVVRGDHLQGDSFAAFYFNGDKLIAADCVNRPQEFVLSKKLLTDDIPIDPARLVDESIPVKELLG